MTKKETHDPVFKTDDAEEAFYELMARRLANDGHSYDLVEVRWANPPIHTAARWAVVRVGD